MKKEVLVKAVRKAKAKGYSDQEIMKQFSKKIPKKEIKGALQKKKFHWIYFSPITKVLLVLIGLLIVVAFIYITLETNCYQDEACFNQLAAQCQRTRVILEKEGNTFEYAIQGQKKEMCVVSIKILALDPTYDEETRTLLEQKSMTCQLPKDRLQRLTETEAVIDYCSGPLKEGMYELIIKKLYGALAENLGSVLQKTGTM